MPMIPHKTAPFVKTSSPSGPAGAGMKAAIRRLTADEMSTSRGKRLALERALGTSTPALGPPERLKTPLTRQLDELLRKGPPAALAKFVTTQRAALEAEVKARNHDAARSLLVALERLLAAPEHVENALAWVGHLGNDRELFDAMAAVLPGGVEAQRKEALRSRVLVAARGALPLLERVISARFGTGKLAEMKSRGARARVFKPFEAPNAFAALAQRAAPR